MIFIAMESMEVHGEKMFSGKAPSMEFA